MRLKNEDYTLLKRIHWELVCCGKEELAAQLLTLLARFETARDKRREHNRINAQANREAGYKWNSSQRPKTSKYYSAEKITGGKSNESIQID